MPRGGDWRPIAEVEVKGREVGRLAQKILDGIYGTLFAMMFLMFIAAILFRYVLNDPISWSIEFSMVCFLVMLFVTGALGIPVSRHISFNIVYAALPQQGRRIFTIVANLVGAAVLAVATPGVYEISVFQDRQATPILHIPFSVFYFAFALFVVVFVVRLIVTIVQLFRPGWRERV